jgi:hypothetical protein
MALPTCMQRCPCVVWYCRSAWRSTATTLLAQAPTTPDCCNCQVEEVLGHHPKICTRFVWALLLAVALQGHCTGHTTAGGSVDRIAWFTPTLFD